MTVRQTLDYYASFRDRWDAAVEAELLERFRIDPAKRASVLSKGQTMQLALLTAICPGPELLSSTNRSGRIGSDRPPRIRASRRRRLPGC